MRLAALAAGFLLSAGSVAFGAPPVVVQDPANVNRNLAVNADGSINVNASASIAGFTPNGSVASLSVSNASSNVALPSGTVVAVANTGSTDASIKLSVGAGTAATTDFILKAGATVGLTVGTNTYINAITASSTTTLSIAGGSGLVTGFGGGGSGGGGAITAASGAYASGSISSGAVASGAYASGSISDGADVTLGTKADAATCATTNTLIACARQLHTDVTSAVPAGTNIIGKVGIDQTTDGTTNAVHLVAGTAIAGKVGIDQTTDGTTNAVHLVAGTAIAGKVGIDQTTPGTTNAVQNISGTTGGVTPFTLTAAASTNATNVKASAGTLYHIGVYNNSATPAWVSFYNTAGTPTCGTSIVYQTMIPANSTSGAGAVEDFATGMAFATGIGICVTTGIAGTGSVAATSYVVGLGYK